MDFLSQCSPAQDLQAVVIQASSGWADISSSTEPPVQFAAAAASRSEAKHREALHQAGL